MTTKTAETKATHTPGPWAFEEGNAEMRGASEVFKARDRTYRIGFVNCEWNNPQVRAEDVANARLIAAAPELLEALREISVACRLLKGRAFVGDRHRKDDPLLISSNVALDHAAQAIAKATA